MDIKYEVTFRDLSDDLNTSGRYRVVDFSFFPVNAADKPSFDPRISATIISLIREFFLKNSDVLLFVCDSNDGRARCRKITFSKWINQDELLPKIVTKYDTEFGESGIFSCSLLVGNEHPLKEEIAEEFLTGDLFYKDSK